ncbi:MAG: hypothetical protein WCH39_11990 [Schlesneria sp.]
MPISLESYGYTIIKINTTATAIGHTIAELPDAVILDLKPPGRDGLEVITRLLEWHEGACDCCSSPRG